MYKLKCFVRVWISYAVDNIEFSAVLFSTVLTLLVFSPGVVKCCFSRNSNMNIRRLSADGTEDCKDGIFTLFPTFVFHCK